MPVSDENSKKMSLCLSKYSTNWIKMLKICCMQTTHQILNMVYHILYSKLITYVIYNISFLIYHKSMEHFVTGLSIQTNSTYFVKRKQNSYLTLSMSNSEFQGFYSSTCMRLYQKKRNYEIGPRFSIFANLCRSARFFCRVLQRLLH